MKKMHLVSLGCPKNLVDSEVMLGTLTGKGYTLVDDPEKADLLLVNTCGFITSAVEEGVDEILRLAEFKKKSPDKKLVVTGCMVQRYGEELKSELPEVDLFTGTDGFQQIASLLDFLENNQPPQLQLHIPEFIMSSSSARQLATPFFRSYLKITEGCNNRCSFCMIPTLRGNLRSRTIADLQDEVEMLDQAGVREVTLIAQDLTAFGNDLSSGEDLVQLLAALVSASDIPWFRLLYLYPTSITDDLLSLMAAQPRIIPYLDIPFQHFSERVLRRMNRHYSGRDLEDLVRRIRQYLPQSSIRTSLMVGFPGEMEADFEELLEQLKLFELDNVGVFEYEDEQGSPAWNMSEKIDQELKRQRYDQVMETQAVISSRRLQRFLGRVEPVLLEGVSAESDLLLEGRSRFQAPGIDGCVYITQGQANAGEIVQVRVTETHTYDLVGEIIGATAP